MFEGEGGGVGVVVAWWQGGVVACLYSHELALKKSKSKLIRLIF